MAAGLEQRTNKVKITDLKKSLAIHTGATK